MSPDAVLIAKAIISLQPTSDYLKDYIFPIVLAFFAALLGGYSAIYINRLQDLKNIAKDNYSAANQAFLTAHECLNHLVAIKSNYMTLVSDEPIMRALEIPTLLVKTDDVKFAPSSLHFIKMIPTANKSLTEAGIWFFKHRLLRVKVPMPPVEDVMHSWRNVVRINAMFNNYNQAMQLLALRNELSEQVKKAVPACLSGKPVTIKEIRQILDDSLLGHFIDINEQFIALADHVIVELYKFLLEFPAIATSNIELSRIKEWGGLPTYSNNKPLFHKLLIKTPSPDYGKIAEYTHLAREKLNLRYNFNDWDKPSKSHS